MVKINYKGVREQINGYGTLDRAFKELFKINDIEISDEPQDIGIAIGYPQQHIHLKSKFKVLYCMFENEKPPIEWEQHLNKFDLIVVPNHWLKRVFQQNYKNLPKIEVVYLGYFIDDFKLKKAIGRHDPFTFFMYQAFNARKGYNETIQAFQKAFGHDMNYRLVLKTQRKEDNTQLYKLIPNIKVIQEAWPVEKLNNYFNQVDCFVFPSRGEGFGITPLEAMATGTPTIISSIPPFKEQYSENIFIFSERGGSVRAYAFQDLSRNEPGEFYKTNVNDLAKKMKLVVKNFDRFNKTAREIGSVWVKNNFNILNNLQELIKILWPDR